MIDFSTLDVPGPTVTDLSRPFWDAVSQGRLQIQHCTACDKAVFYPRPICPHCWANALEWREAGGKGKLASFTQIWKPGHPGWLPAVPYYVGLVQLDEGPTMLSHIIIDERQAPCVGDEVVFKPIRTASRMLPFFTKMNPTRGR